MEIKFDKTTLPSNNQKVRYRNLDTLEWKEGVYLEEECLLEDSFKYFELMPEDFIPEEEKKYEYEVVHCLTQEEWDFVLDTIPKTYQLSKEKHRFQEYCKAYPEGIGVCWEDKSYCGLDYFKEQNAKIYSFSEWCTKFNHKLDFLNKSSNMNNEFKVGNWVIWNACNEPYQIWKIDSKRFWIIYEGKKENYHNYDLEIDGLRKATLEEIQTIVHTLTDEEILEVCKTFYPKGTKFYSASSGDKMEAIHEPRLSPSTKGNVGTKDNGKNGIVYSVSENRFAKIISSPKEETFVLPDKWVVKITDENSKVLNNWRRKQPDFEDEGHKFHEWLTSNNHDGSYNRWCSTVPKGYTEITFEQFKKYVLKENSVFPVEKIEKRKEELKQPLLTPKECYTEDVIEVGDTVEMISHNPIDGFGDVEVGDKGIVKSITIDRYIIDFPNHSEWAGLASELKLIKKASKNVSISKPVKSSNKPEFIPIKVRNVSTFVPQKRIKTFITKPKLLF